LKVGSKSSTGTALGSPTSAPLTEMVLLVRMASTRYLGWGGRGGKFKFEKAELENEVYTQS
jgi:hypothetical protein